MAGGVGGGWQEEWGVHGKRSGGGGGVQGGEVGSGTIAHSSRETNAVAHSRSAKGHTIERGGGANQGSAHPQKRGGGVVVI